MRKVCEERVRGVEVGRIENGVNGPTQQHNADGTKGDLHWIGGYRGHGNLEGGRKKQEEAE